MDTTLKYDTLWSPNVLYLTSKLKTKISSSCDTLSKNLTITNTNLKVKDHTNLYQLSSSRPIPRPFQTQSIPTQSILLVKRVKNGNGADIKIIFAPPHPPTPPTPPTHHETFFDGNGFLGIF